MRGDHYWAGAVMGAFLLSIGCETPSSETPVVTAPVIAGPSSAAPALPPSAPAAQLPTVVWSRSSGPLPAAVASSTVDPTGSRRSADGLLEGRSLVSTTGDLPMAELVDVKATTTETKLVVRGAERFGFAGSLFWAFGGLGTVVYDTATNETRTLAMNGPPVESAEGARLAFVAGTSVQVVDAARPNEQREVFRGPLTNDSLLLQFAGNDRLLVPTSPAHIVTVATGATVTLPADAREVAVSPRGRFIAIASSTPAGWTASLLNASDGRVIGRRALGGGNYTKFSWSVDEAYLVAAASPASIWLMRSANGAASEVAKLEDAMLVESLAVAPGGEVCVWTRTMTMTTCEGSAVYFTRGSKPLKDDKRVCLSNGSAAALVSVDRGRYLSLMGDGSFTRDCHWTLSADGKRYAGVVGGTEGGRVEVVEIASRKTVHSEPIATDGAVGLALFGSSRLEITTVSNGKSARRLLDLGPAAKR